MHSHRFAYRRKGDKLFAPIAGGKFIDLDWLLTISAKHADAFKMAGDLIIDGYNRDDGPFHHDELFFPIAYLYRHAFELKLKDIIELGVNGAYYSFESVESLLTDEHNLCTLWKQARQTIKLHWPEQDEELLNLVGGIINQFHQVDPNGQRLRYATNKEGQRLRYDAIPKFTGLINFKRSVGSIFGYLEGCTFGMHHEIDASNDAKLEMMKDLDPDDMRE